MESSRPDLSSAEASAALADAVSARAEFASRMELPPGYSLITGSGNAVFVLGIALGNSEWRWGSVAFVAALLVQVLAATVAVRRFRALNGAWVNGLNGPRSTWPVLAAYLLALVPLVVGATWLMVEGRPWWSAATAVLALPLTVVVDRWWMARFRAAA